MKTIAVEEFQEIPLSALLSMVEDEDALVLTQGGEGRYVLGAVDDIEWEAFSLSQNVEFIAYLDGCRARGNREGSKSLAEVRSLLVNDGTR